MAHDDLAAYIQGYEERRLARCKELDAVFLPLEQLTERESGVSHLSVSLSGTSIQPTFITKKAALVRIVKIKLKFFILPMTISKLFAPVEFREQFSEFLEERSVDAEEFWFIPAAKNKALRTEIATHSLDNRFREQYLHSYLSRI